LKPYFKFVLPPLEILKEEIELWNKYLEIDTLVDLIKGLQKLKADGIIMSYKSNDLLSCQNIDEQKQLFESYKGLINIPNMPTCVQVIKCQNDEETALSNLILGTELRTLFVLDTQGTKIIKKFSLPSTPVNILTHGLLETDYKLIVACRDDRVYFIRNGEVFIFLFYFIYLYLFILNLFILF